MGEMKGVYKVLVGTPGRPSRTCKDNIRTDLQEVGCEEMDWMDLAQDRNR